VPRYSLGDLTARRAVPLTRGMDLLLGARQKSLMVSGVHIREILRRTIEGPPYALVAPSLPFAASTYVTLIVDEAAGWPRVDQKRFSKSK